MPCQRASTLRKEKREEGRKGNGSRHMGYFVEVFTRRGLRVNAGKIKVMVLGGEEGLEHVSEVNYLGCIFDESCI